MKKQVEQKISEGVEINSLLLSSGLDENDWIVQKYQILQEVGQGAFGNVYKAKERTYVPKTLERNQSQHGNNDQYVAIKKIVYDRKFVQREVPMLIEVRQSQKCDNIIAIKDKYLKMNIQPNNKNVQGKVAQEYLYIITDFMPFTICDLNLQPAIYCQDQRGCMGSSKNNVILNISKNKCLESIKQVMHGVFKGLRDLHSLGITHRDIKLSNILIDNNKYPITQVKICDLGSSKKLISNSKDESTQSLNYIGTRAFRAPELLVGNKYYDTKIDIWSAGIVFLKLILGFLCKKSNIFSVKTSKALAKVISEQIGDPTQEELCEMLATNDLMKKSIKAGVSSEEILKKRYKKIDAQMKNNIPPECVDILHRILELSPKRRISAEDALKHPYFQTQINFDKNLDSEIISQRLSLSTQTTSPCTNTQNQGIHTTYYNVKTNQ